MKGYLGETPAPNHPLYSTYTPAQWALLYIQQYGGIDGAHHKDWVLDQIARILNGAPVTVTEASWTNGEKEYRFEVGESPQYHQWVHEVRSPMTDGVYDYDYELGIAP